MNIESGTEAAVVAEITKAACEPKIVHVVDPDGYTAVVLGIPNDLNVADLEKQFDERRGHPRRAKGQVVAESLEAFIALVKRRMSDATVVYVHDDQVRPALVAVLNDHEEGAISDAGFRDLRVVYYPTLSDEWKAWTGADCKPMAQGDFAAFLEDHSLDVIDAGGVGEKTRAIVESLGVSVASPATLRALARDFSVRVKQTVREARSLATGETQIIFGTEHSGGDGKPLTVPGAFLIAIPIYQNGPAYVLVARLRYRVADERIYWSFKLTRAEEAKRDTMKDMMCTVQKDVGCLVVEGQA